MMNRRLAKYINNKKKYIKNKQRTSNKSIKSKRYCNNKIAKNKEFRISKHIIRKNILK